MNYYDIIIRTADVIDEPYIVEGSSSLSPLPVILILGVIVATALIIRTLTKKKK